MWRKLVCLVGMLAAVSACGAAGAAPTPNTSVSVDPSSPLSVQVAQQLSAQGLKVTDVKCPSVAREEGTTATCTGDVAGVPLNLTVTFAAGNQIIVAAAP